MPNEGVNRLARVIQDRVKDLGDEPPFLDFGTIQADMSLLTNMLPISIPRTDYVVCRSVTWGVLGSVLFETQPGGTEEPHTHEILTDEKRRGLQPGDRVLVAWVGDDACVIDLILPASVV